MRPNQVENIAKYIHIAGKLQRTFILNMNKFPELEKLQNTVLSIPIDRTQPNPFLHHLEKIAQVLKDNSTTYVVRHLHHYFCKDVEALLEGWDLIDCEYYLNMAEYQTDSKVKKKRSK